LAECDDVYIKLPTSIFLSLSLLDVCWPELLFLECLVTVSPLISESLVVRISLLRSDDFISKLNWTGLIGLLGEKSVLSNSRGD
jgi:hypothetical protein